jgi:NAD(P)-dependent dehydrogenase (short-subunit alcohol dehydrogenase family)
MKTQDLAEKVAVVPSASEGIGAAIAKLMRRRSVIDIVERFQTQHALQRGARNGIRSRGSGRHVARSRAAFADSVNQIIQKYKHKGNPNHEN